jgi:hypothetical protein
MIVEAGRLIIVPSRENPRAGRADDARRLAEAGDDASSGRNSTMMRPRPRSRPTTTRKLDRRSRPGTIEDFVGCLAERGTPRLPIEEVRSTGWPSSEI